MFIIAECLSSYEEADLLTRHICSRLYSLEEFQDSWLMFAVSFCLRELLNNAVEHGNKFDGARKVKCIFHYIDSNIYISVKDEGTGFCLNSALDEIDCNDIVRSRTRGIKTLEQLGFKIDCRDGWVIAMISIDGRKESE